MLSWNHDFDVIIMVYDLIQDEFDSCVYKEVSGRALTMNVQYNDDISFLENDIPILHLVKAWLSRKILRRILGRDNFYSRNNDLLG